MHHLIYLSKAAVPFTDSQLQDLLLVARTHNAQQDITGLLLYGNDQFVQVLEGEETAVRALYERIRQDTRHRDVSLFADKGIEQRAFADWAMGFHALAPEQALKLTGYIQPEAFDVATLELRQADAQLLQLLRSFVLPPAG